VDTVAVGNIDVMAGQSVVGRQKILAQHTIIAGGSLLHRFKAVTDQTWKSARSANRCQGGCHWSLQRAQQK